MNLLNFCNHYFSILDYLKIIINGLKNFNRDYKKIITYKFPSLFQKKVIAIYKQGICLSQQNLFQINLHSPSFIIQLMMNLLI